MMHTPPATPNETGQLPFVTSTDNVSTEINLKPSMLTSLIHVEVSVHTTCHAAGHLQALVIAHSGRSDE